MDIGRKFLKISFRRTLASHDTISKIKGGAKQNKVELVKRGRLAYYHGAYINLRCENSCTLHDRTLRDPFLSAE